MNEDQSASFAGPEGRARVLVAEDDPFQQAALTQALRAAGYAAQVVSNGQEAVAAALAEPPDVILLDRQMPVMDGLETARQLKAEARTRSIPILMVTATDDVEERVRGLEAGADDYVPKPYHLAELLARIRANLRLVELQRQVEAQRIRLAQLEILHDVAVTVNHEVNNPLMILQGRAEMLAADLPEDAVALRQDVEAILEAAERIRQVAWKLKHVVEPVQTQYTEDETMLDLDRSIRPAEGT
jgi:DNA-binding response OmpR family regulator